MKSVLFVCTANQCRSPMAEALLKDKVARLGQLGEWDIGSAGVRAGTGIPATALTRRVMSRRGLDLDAHRSRFAGEALLRTASLVVVMTEVHRKILATEFPTLADRIVLLSSLVGEDDDLVDPVGGPEQAYESCAETIAGILDRGFERLAALADR